MLVIHDNLDIEIVQADKISIELTFACDTLKDTDEIYFIITKNSNLVFKFKALHSDGIAYFLMSSDQTKAQS